MKRKFSTPQEHLKWAEAEVEAVRRDFAGIDYPVSAYEEAFNILQDALKSTDVRSTIDVLKMMLDGELLAPIQDNPEEFTEIPYGIYQSLRLPSLYYMLDENNEKFLIDQYGVFVIDIDEPDMYVVEPFVINLWYKEYNRLKFPYYTPEKPQIIYITRYKAYEGEEDYDTLGIGYAKTAFSNEIPTEIQRFFKRDSEERMWEEITFTEYAYRCKKAGALDE